ncbi:MAG: Ku protein [Janthinobacterium lividum]
MPHMIWKGAISFGLVHVPVKLYPATSHQNVGFDLLDKHSLDPIGYRKINKATGKEVSTQDIVRGIEYEKGHYVVLSDEEIRAANVESTQTIDIVAFIDAPELSFLYLDTPYFLEPDRGGDKVYALLRDALVKANKIGIATVVMHGKQHLAALVPVGAALAMNTLRWANEVRDLSEFKLPEVGGKKAAVSERELDMAMRLIDDMSDKWEPANFHDTFRDDIMALVDRKVKAGKAREIGALDAPRDTGKTKADVLDLSELLRRSLGGGGKGGGRARAASASKDADDAKDPKGLKDDKPARAGGAEARPAARRKRA